MSNAILRDLAALLDDIETNRHVEISQLRECLASRDNADDLVDEEIAEMKGYFGAKAANAVTDDTAERAIAEAESWITDNVSNGTIDRRIAGALTIREPQELLRDWAA